MMKRDWSPLGVRGGSFDDLARVGLERTSLPAVTVSSPQPGDGQYPVSPSRGASATAAVGAPEACPRGAHLLRPRPAAGERGAGSPSRVRKAPYSVSVWARARGIPHRGCPCYGAKLNTGRSQLTDTPMPVTNTYSTPTTAQPSREAECLRAGVFVDV